MLHAGFVAHLVLCDQNGGNLLILTCASGGAYDRCFTHRVMGQRNIFELGPRYRRDRRRGYLHIRCLLSHLILPRASHLLQ
ncbi:hypothetical protein EAS54_32330 [Bradyrhizobium guangzhouense]|nr:hypothetical protein EAS54_32330 [Bradyrhizobium guangzhouense]